MKIIEPTREENNNLNQLFKEDENLFEMIRAEREFLNSLILRYKPKKILEVGVSAGISAILILNAIKNDPDAKLYSVDLSTEWYKDKRKKTGYLVEKEHPELTKDGKWTLLTGKLAYEQMEAIGNEIDFVLLDTAHCHPGELLDYLMILPFLKKNCPLVLHDVNIHTTGFAPPEGNRGITNSTLFSAFTGERIVLKNNMRYGMIGGTPFPNIGGVLVAEDAKEHVYEVINALTLPWDFFPSDEDLIKMRKFFARFYDEVSLEYFDLIVNYHQFIREHSYEKRSFKNEFKRKCRFIKNRILTKLTWGSLRKVFQAKVEKYIQSEKFRVFFDSLYKAHLNTEFLWNDKWRIFDKRVADKTEVNDSTVMDVCFFANDQSALSTCTAIASILDSSNFSDRFRFHILDGGLSSKNQKKLQKVVKNEMIIFHRVDESFFKNASNSKEVADLFALYHSFLIPKLLPDINRVLYLDSDIIVRDSLVPLWKHDLNGACLAAVHDHCGDGCKMSSHYYHGEKEARRLGLSDYVNTGVMLIDADKWRNEHREEKLFEYVQSVETKTNTIDQDAINVVFAGSIDFLRPLWNYIINEEYGFPMGQIRRNALQATIVHFTGENKSKLLKKCPFLTSIR